jgi:hypothetical protein
LGPRGPCLCARVGLMLIWGDMFGERRRWTVDRAPWTLGRGASPPPDHSLLGIAMSYRLQAGSRPQQRLCHGPDVRSFRHLGWSLPFSLLKGERPKLLSSGGFCPSSSCIHLVDAQYTHIFPKESLVTNKQRTAAGRGRWPTNLLKSSVLGIANHAPGPSIVAVSESTVPIEVHTRSPCPSCPLLPPPSDETDWSVPFLAAATSHAHDPKQASGLHPNQVFLPFSQRAPLR